MNLFEFDSKSSNEDQAQSEEQLGSQQSKGRISPFLRVLRESSLALPRILSSPLSEVALQELRSDSVVMMLQFQLLSQKPGLKERFKGLSVNGYRALFLRAIKSVISVTEEDSFYKEAPEIEILYPELLLGPIENIGLSDLFDLIDTLAQSPSSLDSEALKLFKSKQDEYRKSIDYAKVVLIPNPSVEDINDIGKKYK